MPDRDPQPGIDRLRRFQRIVTREVGALDQSFLGRGRPLNAARVLNAIGRGIGRDGPGRGTGEVGTLRAYLGLDSGLMSRLLRGLEDEGLVTTAPAPDDARRRVARLTAAGEAEFAAYETLSNARAGQILAAHPDPDALLAAMDLVSSALGRDTVEIRPADPQSEAARACLARYYGELARRFERGFDVTLSRDPEAGDMRAPKGVFLLALSDGVAIGCAGLKGHAVGTADAWGEVKRVWVDPAARGLRLAPGMMAEIENRARGLGFGLLRLDTNSALPEALALYRRLGWQEIDRFNDDPYPDTFFEKRL
ncbi:MAG: MarR family transcriptional regulator [Maritimibacter sp.]|nr:MarR family transcriptional regulator [Maritimibacter sp.]